MWIFDTDGVAESGSDVGAGFAAALSGSAALKRVGRTLSWAAPLAAAAGVGIYNGLSGRNLLRDSLDQWTLVKQPLEHFEDIWRSRPATEVVACLTTIPSRLDGLELTFKSLLYQSWAPRKIRLHLPEFSQREGVGYQVPEWMLGRDWLEVVRCEDWGPATKLVPALQLDPQQRLLVVDDDMLYPPTLLENLLRQSQQHPDWIVCSSGWRAPADLIDRPTTFWSNLNQLAPAPVKSTRVNQPYAVDVFQGYSGLLLKPEQLDVAALKDYSQAPEAVRWVDDVWLSGHALVPKMVCPAPRYCFERWRGREAMKAGSLGRMKNRGDGQDPATRNNSIALRHLQDRWLNALP